MNSKSLKILKTSTLYLYPDLLSSPMPTTLPILLAFFFRCQEDICSTYLSSVKKKVSSKRIGTFDSSLRNALSLSYRKLVGGLGHIRDLS